MEAIFAALTPAEKEYFLDSPALAPPPGVVPNFIDPPNKLPLCLGLTIATTTVSVIVVSLRLYTRIFCIKKMRLEDYLTIVVLGFFAWYTYIAINCYITTGGFVHQWNLRVRDMPGLLKRINLANIAYGIVMLLIKVCILLDWIHIFAPSHGLRGTFYWACIGNIIANAMFYLIYIFLQIFACKPREKSWNFLLPGKCIDVYIYYIVAGAFNLALDLVMLAMPHGIIWRLGFSRKKKIAISGIFIVGTLGCLCGAFKIVSSTRFKNNPDKSYYIDPLALQIQGEMTAGFLVLCVPSLPKLIKDIPMLQRLFSSGTPKPNSRLGLPSWIRGQEKRHAPRRPRPDDLEYSEYGDFSQLGTLDDSQLSPSTMDEKSLVRVAGQEGLSQSVSESAFITVHEVK
jgi:hypothetical protein